MPDGNLSPLDGFRENAALTAIVEAAAAGEYEAAFEKGRLLAEDLLYNQPDIVAETRLNHLLSRVALTAGDAERQREFLSRALFKAIAGGHDKLCHRILGDIEEYQPGIVTDIDVPDVTTSEDGAPSFRMN